MITAGGLSVYRDTGAPVDRDDYTTLILIHGYVWHGGTFIKLLPLAATHGVRIIVLNRREYPGSAPYTAEERALLPYVPDKPLTDQHEIRSATQKLETFMRDRAHELYLSIEDLIVSRNLPAVRADSQTGGIVLVGWSQGATWMTALLRHIAEFPIGPVNLRHYVRRVVLSDPPACLLGYPYPEQDPWNPFFDTSLTYEERGKAFTNWITAYFAHGDTVETFERRTGLQTPPSTLSSMSPDDFTTMVHIPPGVPGGSDWALLHGCAALGVYGKLREGALHLSGPPRDDGAQVPVGDDWCDIEVRHVWSDQSIWECPYAAQMLRQEVAEGARAGRPMRRVTTLCVKGTNHFGQWDHPERTLEAFLAVPEDCDA